MELLHLNRLAGGAQPHEVVAGGGAGVAIEKQKWRSQSGQWAGRQDTSTKRKITEANINSEPIADTLTKSAGLVTDANLLKALGFATEGRWKEATRNCMKYRCKNMQNYGPKRYPELSDDWLEKIKDEKEKNRAFVKRYVDVFYDNRANYKALRELAVYVERYNIPMTPEHSNGLVRLLNELIEATDKGFAFIKEIHAN